MSLIAELKRRNVFRVAAAYMVLTWLLLQVGDVLFETLELPSIWGKGLLALLLLGFIPVIIFSWVYEMTPEGVRKESEISVDESITAHTAKKLDLAVIVLLVMAMGMFGIDRFIGAGDSPPVAVADLESPGDPPADPANAEIDRSVAVLPFADMSPEGDQAFFADGIAEEILNTLVRVPQLRVAARTSSFKFRGENRDITDIGQQLNVGTVLEGSVRKNGDQIRVTAQLINVENGFHLWSDSFDESVADLFEIQNRIARQIAGAMRIQLDTRSQSAGPSNPAAFDALMRGRHLIAERHVTDNRYRGIEEFALATTLDPGYAEAWAHYAYAMSISAPGGAGASSDEWESRIRNATERAISLEPDHLMALVVAAKIDFYFENEHQEAISSLQELTTRYPNLVEGQYALSQVLREAGARRQSLQTLRLVLALDPLNLTRRRVYAQGLADDGRFDEAIRVLEEVVRLGVGGSNVGYMTALYLDRMIVLRNADWQSVHQDLIERLQQLESDDLDIQPFLEWMAPVVAALNRDDKQRELLREELDQISFEENPFAVWTFVRRALLLGETEMLVAVFHQQVDRGGMSEVTDSILMSADYDLEPEILNHPAYIAFWQRPDALAMARVRVANGATQGIPPIVVEQVSQP